MATISFINAGLEELRAAELILEQVAHLIPRGLMVAAIRLPDDQLVRNPLVDIYVGRVEEDELIVRFVYNGQLKLEDVTIGDCNVTNTGLVQGWPGHEALIGKGPEVLGQILSEYKDIRISQHRRAIERLSAGAAS